MILKYNHESQEDSDDSMKKGFNLHCPIPEKQIPYKRMAKALKTSCRTQQA